jgi:hypothetical protein
MIIDNGFRIKFISTIQDSEYGCTHVFYYNNDNNNNQIDQIKKRLDRNSTAFIFERIPLTQKERKLNSLFIMNKKMDRSYNPYIKRAVLGMY